MFSSQGETARKLELFGLPIYDTTINAAAAAIIESAKLHKPTRIGFINAHCVNEIHKNAQYRSSLSHFDMLFADGMGMKIAARAGGFDLAENVNGTDLFPVLCEQAAANRTPIFLLGGKPGVSGDVYKRMSMNYPGLNIAGTYHGYFSGPAEEEAVIEMINRSGAEIVLVAFGVPLQEVWIEANRHRLKPAVLVGVGGLFDYYSGQVPRAPLALRRVGFEWAWRLALEPRRLWRRYVLGNVEFLARVAKRQPSQPALEKSELQLRHSDGTGTPTPVRREARISKLVFRDAAFVAELVASTAATFATLTMADVLQNDVMSLLPAYVLFLGYFLRTSSSTPLSMVRVRNVEMRVMAHVAAVLGAIGLHTVLGNHIWVAPGTIMIWAAGSAVAGTLTFLMARGLAKSNWFGRRIRRRLAVMGAGPMAAKVYQEVASGGTTYEFVGLFEDRVNADRAVDCGIEVSGSVNDLKTKAGDGLIDEILIALPRTATRRTREVARKFEQLPVDVHICTHIATEFPKSRLGGLHTSMIGTVGLLQLSEKPLQDWAGVVKRIEDVVLSSMILALAIPIMIVAALAIKLDSAGPVIFRQRRQGLNGRVFNIYKFRTMTVMEDGDVVRQATRNDSRVTRVGKFLRRASIDELPQLFNVLRGDMSLVGPRPHAVAHDDFFSEIILRYSNRYQMKPGLTGLAQVSSYRGETQDVRQMQKRIQHDLWYIENWSLLLDLKIILMTPFVVMSFKNAH